MPERARPLIQAVDMSPYIYVMKDVSLYLCYDDCYGSNTVSQFYFSLTYTGKKTGPFHPVTL